MVKAKPNKPETKQIEKHTEKKQWWAVQAPRKLWAVTCDPRVTVVAAVAQQDIFMDCIQGGQPEKSPG